MSLLILQDARLYALLHRFDLDLAEAARTSGCAYCGAVLHSAPYPRKPRGGPARLDPSHAFRFSFCCAREGCRRRRTPPSVRFLGRRVYFGAVVVLVSALRDGLSARRVAALRFSIVGPLLAAPPKRGELRAALEQLAQTTWRHPITGEPTRFGLSTLERWYYAARGAPRDPVGQLRRKLRKDAGQHPSLSLALREVLRDQYRAHRSWSMQLHADTTPRTPDSRGESSGVARRFAATRSPAPRAAAVPAPSCGACGR